MEIKVMDKVLKANDAWADENRKLLDERGILMVNLIGSPGAGKTKLLEATIDHLKDEVKIGVIEGDIATTRDAQRIKGKNVPVFQINTGTACHLDAHLVHSAIKELIKDQDLDVIFVENIGNLVCPAEFDIGEKAKIAVLSIMEGDDKIEKYPLLFHEAQAMVLSKMDLLEHSDFNIEQGMKDFRKLNDAPCFECDSISGKGVSAWCGFLMQIKKN